LECPWPPSRDCQVLGRPRGDGHPTAGGHLAAAQLISTLADAVDTARAQDRAIVLPALSAPRASNPPVKLAAQDRQRRTHRARGV
jgi:hypothetical protein